MTSRKGLMVLVCGVSRRRSALRVHAVRNRARQDAPSSHGGSRGDFRRRLSPSLNSARRALPRDRGENEHTAKDRRTRQNGVAVC
eukprot:7379536-Prymnesium_polylepis.1